ncbi:hypothetical protein [Rhizobium giardinii]|uniref:hypothetical protein n=1 Tax=Rhizobium giardinii TaxID=56731 RepID=UPI000373E4E9
MEYFARIDVSLEASSVCLVDAAGKIIRETKVVSDPDALIEHFVLLKIRETASRFASQKYTSGGR